jgi:hypothetical protein
MPTPDLRGNRQPFTRGLQVALSLRHACEATAQLSSHIQWRGAFALSEQVEQCRFAGIRRPDEQNELALKCSDFLNEAL